jgi:hypothetical protein
LSVPAVLGLFSGDPRKQELGGVTVAKVVEASRLVHFAFGGSFESVEFIGSETAQTALAQSSST